MKWYKSTLNSYAINQAQNVELQSDLKKKTVLQF